MTYQVIVSKAVQKQIEKLPLSMQIIIKEKLSTLKSDPRPSGIVKLKGYDFQYRLRVSDYRIRYEIDDKNLIVKILQCKHRREIYRDQ